MADGDDLTVLIEQVAGGFGFTPKKKADPLDKTTAESRFVSVGGRVVRRAPIGVEPGYTAPYRGQRLSETDELDSAAGYDWAASGVGARYDATDLDLFAGLAPESIAEIQSALMRSGLVGQVAKGVWDPGTAGAMQKVLAFANQRGLLWQDALDLWAEAGAASGLGGGGGGGGARGPVFTPQLSNPDDLRKVFKQVAFNTLGGNFLDDAAYERMVTGYQDAEMKAQRAQFDAAVGGGGTTVDAPSAQTFSEDTIKAENEPLAEAHGIMQYGKVFESLLGGA